MACAGSHSPAQYSPEARQRSLRMWTQHRLISGPSACLLQPYPGLRQQPFTAGSDRLLSEPGHTHAKLEVQGLSVPSAFGVAQALPRRVMLEEMEYWRHAEVQA